MSWRGAQRVADQLPHDDPVRMSMRIAPRSFLCATAFVDGSGSKTGFDELRELCAAADDERSLAVGMAGLVMEKFVKGRYREASRLASEHTQLLESIGDPVLTVALSFAAIAAKFQASDIAEVSRLAQRVIDLADGDPTKGNLVFGSPLASALTFRGAARCALGESGWKGDFREGIALARAFDATSLSGVIFYTYLSTITSGVLRSDETALRDTADALEMAQRSSADLALNLARTARGIALVYQESSAERGAGLDLLARVRDDILLERFSHQCCGSSTFTLQARRQGPEISTLPSN
jgi:adenylate cyclase